MVLLSKVIQIIMIILIISPLTVAYAINVNNINFVYNYIKYDIYPKYVYIIKNQENNTILIQEDIHEVFYYMFSNTRHIEYFRYFTISIANAYINNSIDVKLIIFTTTYSFDILISNLNINQFPFLYRFILLSNNTYYNNLRLNIESIKNESIELTLPVSYLPEKVGLFLRNVVSVDPELKEYFDRGKIVLLVVNIFELDNQYYIQINNKLKNISVYEFISVIYTTQDLGGGKLRLGYLKEIDALAESCYVVLKNLYGRDNVILYPFLREKIIELDKSIKNDYKLLSIVSPFLTFATVSVGYMVSRSGGVSNRRLIFLAVLLYAVFMWLWVYSWVQDSPEARSASGVVAFFSSLSLGLGVYFLSSNKSI